MLKALIPSKISMGLLALLTSLSGPAPAKEPTVFKAAVADYIKGDFARIDRAYDAIPPKGERMSFYVFTVAIGKPRQIKKLKDWTGKHPKSATGWAALGLAHLELAKALRVKDPRSRAFQEAMDTADLCVDKAYALSPKDINMSSFQIECRKVGGWGGRKKRAEGPKAAN